MSRMALRLGYWVLGCALCLALPLMGQTPVFINEIHYDNTGTDAGEAIEIVGPAGTDLTGWSIVLYNGTGGAVYDTDALSGTILDIGGSGFGVVVLTYPSNGIQNGSPDGIALVNASSTVVQFLSYEGTFTAVGGPANGMLSTDIGVSENGSEPLGQSLRLSGTGTNYEDFTWNAPAAASFGSFNTGQSFGGVDQPPSVLSTTPTNGGTGISVDASITINFSEAVNLAGSWFSIIGSSSGSHTATLSGGPQNFILNPDVDFSINETVTVTLFAANVTDQDAADPPDNMEADYAFTFSTTAVSSSVVINELDSDTPGTDALEFIELYDGGAGNTSLSGLVVVFYNGANDLSYAAIDLDGFSTDANGFFVLGNTGVANVDLTFAVNTLQNGADAVALYFGNASNFPTGTAVTTSNLIDAIVYDTDDADDAGLLVLLNAGQPQVNENGAVDGANHSSQRIPNGSGGARNTDTYAPFPPTPGTENVGPPPPVMAEIFEIQGTGLTSPFANQTVITENNVVTAVAPDGFSMQTPAARVDADDETSNGIFVFTGSAPAVAVGDFVNVTGQAVEFFAFTEISSNPIVTVVSSGNPLPAPVILDASTPSPNQPQPANELERYEGMLIQINGGAVTASNQTFGSDPIAEVFIVAAPDRTFREPGIAFPGLPSLPVWDGNPEVFELDPDRLGLPNQIVPAGSSFDAVGVLGFEFNGYELWPKQFSFTPATLPVAVRARNADEVTIGTLNLFRLFDNVNDPGSQDDGAVVSAAEYARRLAKFSLYIRNVLGAPDILAVEEAEKLAVLQALANKIASDNPGIVYTFYLVEGNDVGGIDTGFLVRSTVQVDAITQLGATETLSVDGSLLHDRPPLLLEGSFVIGSTSSPIVVMAVHNRSLGGIEDPVDGPRVRQKRLEQAQSIAQKVQDMQTSNPDVRLVVTGDFNAYQFTDGFVDAVGQIAGSFTPGDNLLSGPDLVSPNLAKQVLSLPAEQQYSFIFGGSAQVLDHMLTSQALTPTGLQYGRGNADAAGILISDDTTPLRSSDHDGLVMYLDVVPPAITVAGSPATLWPPNHQYHTFAVADFITSVTDGGTPGLSLADVFIVSATSDEPENGNDDGNTTDDIVIVNCQTVQFRGERQDNGNGRVYTIHVAAEDASGNVGTASFQVKVPVTQTGAGAVDNGPVYEVLSGCSAPTIAATAGTAPVAREAVTGLELEKPSKYALEQNYPNPFNPETEIRFQIPEASHVVIKIYNTLGHEIVTLADGRYDAGYHRVRWNGKNSSGRVLASGVYFYQLRTSSFNQVRQMNLLR
ncbi:MAG: Ig-like domain-containing protein [bacterium]